MKKLLVVLAAMMMVIFMVSGAFAAAAPTVDVQATVERACVSSGNGAMSVTINPATVGAGGYTFSADGSVTQPQVKCTKSTTAVYTITASNTENAGGDGDGSMTGLLKSAGHASIPYTITWNKDVAGNGFLGADVTIGIDGTIAQADAQAAEYAAAAYQETVTLTFNY
jgi:hypothetical protein